jgi:hypothetical protein
MITPKTIYLWDLDDTLILSASKVLVNNAITKKTSTLTPAEYAVYEPKSGDRFDYSEFSNLKDPQIIKANFELFAKILKKTSPTSKTAILTARGPEIKADIEQLLKKYNLPNIAIHAVGDSNPQAKVNIIQKYIDKGYARVRFWDDSRSNVLAVNAMKANNPGVDIEAKLVVSH